MFPNLSSKKISALILVVGFLGGAFLAVWRSEVRPAQAYFSKENASIPNLVNLTNRDMAGMDVNAASILSTVDVRVSAGANDAEQNLSSGSMSVNSTDLELVNDPDVAQGIQSVGLRFMRLNIPQGATITQAYLEFEVYEASGEATSLVLYGQNADSARVFTTNINNITKRPKTSASVGWNNIPAWNTVGAKVQSPDLSPIVQEIVNRNGWASGNNMVILITGSGRRVASAYESDATNAVLLHVNYEISDLTPTPPTPAPTNTPVPTTQPPTETNTPISTDQPVILNMQVSAGANDAEQRLNDGFVYLDSSDLEFIYDPGVTQGTQSVGMRFSGVSIPKGSTILQAYLEFEVDEATSETTSLVLRGQAADNAGVFTTSPNNITSRPKTSASVSWNNVPAWNTVGAKVQSPDLSPIVQEIVNRNGWASGNSLVIFADGSGRRVASAYESGASNAALLHIVYLPIVSTTPTTPPPTPTNTPVPTDQASVLEMNVSAGANDAEQRLSDGFMYLDSTDLEQIYDPGVTQGTQSVGMRFTGVSIPKGSTILQAYLEFEVDEATSETTSLMLRGQAADNAGVFTTSTNNITSRPKTSASVSWNNVPAWNTVGAKVQSPDLSPIVQEIVNRNGWASGNNMVILIDGSGRRVATSYESGTSNTTMLRITYQTAGGTPTPPPTPNPQPTPVGQDSSWNLVFQDEFNGGSLDTSKWHTCFWWADVTCTIESNNEMELYNPEDVLVGNGILRLRAQKRDMIAWNGELYHYTSGLVMTGGRKDKIPPGFTFTYGYAEARVKVPAGQGLWPAFWMLPASYVSRPEIDIMEILGHEPNVYHMNYHYIGGDVGQTWNGPDFSADWHVLGLDWQPNAIVWYVDGVERWRYENAANISNVASYLLLNLAVGGDWPGPPDSNTPFPSYYDIDYVRVWQK